jgi:hypothetical protein
MVRRGRTSARGSVSSTRRMQEQSRRDMNFTNLLRWERGCDLHSTVTPHGPSDYGSEPFPRKPIAHQLSTNYLFVCCLFVYCLGFRRCVVS